MNQTQLIGRLTKDPELRYSPSGIPTVRFTVAVNREFTNQQGEREADFISCVAFRKLAENLSNFQKKGNRIAVVGRIQTGSYENQQGQRIYTTEVIANNIEFLDYRSEQQSEQNPTPNYQTNTNSHSNSKTQYNANTGQSQPFGNSGQFNTNQDPFASGGMPPLNDEDLPF